MNELLIQMALEGYRVTFTNGGFSLKDSVEIRVSRVEDINKPAPHVHSCMKILTHRDFPFVENHLRDAREEVAARVRGDIL